MEAVQHFLKPPCVTTIIRGVYLQTCHESMKNEEGSHQHSLNITASLRICLKLCPQLMKIPVSNARCTIGPGGWASCGRFGWRWRDLPPWFQHGRWRSFAVMYDGMWRSLLTTYPRPFVMGGRCCGASRSEEVLGSTFSVWSRAIISIHFQSFTIIPFVLQKTSLANLLSGKE